MYTINIWAILVSAIVSFGIGALWYSSFLFGKEWMSLIKVSDKDIEGMKARGMWKSYIIHFVATLISLLVLGFAIAAIGVVNAGDGAIIGFLAWLGFVAPIGVSELLWKKVSMKLVMIDSINILLSLVISGAIIAAW